MTQLRTLRRALGILLAPLTPMVAGLGACAPERPIVLRIGDGVPRDESISTLLDLIVPGLELPDAQSPAPGGRLEVARWSLIGATLNVAEAEQARRFVDDPSVIAVVGHAGSKGTLLAAPIYRDAGMPLIIPTATARELRGVPGLFMLAPSDDAVGAFLADAALDSLRGRRIAMMHVADAYGDGIRQGVVERLTARGTALAGSAVMTGRECVQDDLATEVIGRSLLERARPDVVILALSQQASVCIIQLLVRVQPGIRIITSDSYTPADHVGITADERRAIHALSFWEPGTDSLSRHFVARYRAELGRDPDPAHALAYDAFLLVRQAAVEGHVTRESVTQWLRELGTAKHPPVQGVTGPIHFQGPRSAVLHLRNLGVPRPGE